MTKIPVTPVRGNPRDPPYTWIEGDQAGKH